MADLGKGTGLFLLGWWRRLEPGEGLKFRLAATATAEEVTGLGRCLEEVVSPSNPWHQMGLSGGGLAQDCVHNTGCPHPQQHRGSTICGSVTLDKPCVLSGLGFLLCHGDKSIQGS